MLKSFLRYEKKELVEMATQSCVEMVDAMCQTMDEVVENLDRIDDVVEKLDKIIEPSQAKDDDEEMEEEDEQVDREEPEKKKIKLEANESEEEDGGDAELEQANKIQQILENAMDNQIDSEYPCKLCERRFSGLYGVKSHIISMHEDFVKNSTKSKVKIKLEEPKKKIRGARQFSKN